GSQTAAGWTLPSLGGTNPGTNLRVYRQGAGNQYYMRVNDSAARAGTTDEAAGSPTRQEARIRGYETMSTITDPSSARPFPTVAQFASGLFIRKSSTGDGVTHSWIIAADARTMYMWILTGDNSGRYCFWGFGDIYSFKTSDTGHCLIAARGSESSATMTSGT